MKTTDTSAAAATTITKLTDLAAEKLGGKMLSRSNDFFSDMENLIKAGMGIFIADKYTDRGRWMDGWESRRCQDRSFFNRREREPSHP